jgi:hypothetical protein
MDKRDDNKSDQSSNKKPDPEIHDRFNHETYASNSLTHIEFRSHGRIPPGSPFRLA